MSVLKNLGQNANDIKEEEDTLGGGGVRESGLYLMEIVACYLDVSAGGANSANFILKDEKGNEYREALWFTNKKGEEFYVYNDEKRFLPGYNIFNAIAQLTTGYGLNDLDEPEEKTIEVYDFDKKEMVQKEKDCMTQLHGEHIYVGIIKEIVDKQKKNDTTGKYENTGETREQNVIDKVFHAETKMTVAEYRAEAEEALFVDKWDKKWTGKERNKAKGTGSGAASGAPSSAAGSKPQKSLFNKK